MIYLYFSNSYNILNDNIGFIRIVLYIIIYSYINIRINVCDYFKIYYYNDDVATECLSSK